PRSGLRHLPFASLFPCLHPRPMHLIYHHEWGRLAMTQRFNQPLGGNEMPRVGGFATMMRLPIAESAEGLDAGFIGIPMDIGTSNRSGTRLGPRQIRDESRMMRPYNMATAAAPFEHLQVADIGDVPINTFDLKKSVDIITAHYDGILAHGAIPLTLGGDHTRTWPI